MKDSSVTDWIQAIAAAFGAIGLVWTLSLQRKTTNEQIRIRLLEEERDRRSLLPQFVVELLNSGPVEAPKSYIRLTLKKNAARLVAFNPIINDHFKVLLGFDVLDMNPEDATTYEVEFLRDELFTPYSRVMHLTFVDTGLNFYFQDIFIVGRTVKISDPALDYEDLLKNMKPPLTEKFKDFLTEFYELFIKIW